MNKVVKAEYLSKFTMTKNESSMVIWDPFGTMELERALLVARCSRIRGGWNCSLIGIASSNFRIDKLTTQNIATKMNEFITNEKVLMFIFDKKIWRKD